MPHPDQRPDRRIASLRKGAKRFREIATENETAISGELLDMADEFDRQADELENAKVPANSAA